MPDDTYTPLAALRLIRRAAHRDVDPTDLLDAIATVTGPFGDVTDAWDRLIALLARPSPPARTAVTKGDLTVALMALDAALAVFWGSTGWEQPHTATAPDVP
jgi:hypothetical protein